MGGVFAWEKYIHVINSLIKLTMVGKPEKASNPYAETIVSLTHPTII